MAGIGMGAARDLANKVETFVREVVVPYERDLRRDHHGIPGRWSGQVQPHLSVDHARCALSFASQAAWPFAERCARCAARGAGAAGSGRDRCSRCAHFRGLRGRRRDR